MEPQASVPQEIEGSAGTSYTVSLTARACLQALRLAAWIEAMVLAHRAADPQGAGSWLWFLGRCVLFTLGAYFAIGVLAGISKRRDARGRGAQNQQRQEPHETPDPVVQFLFDTTAYEATAGALLFHFGSPIWMWIFA
jgi:hypothetical protein